MSHPLCIECKHCRLRAVGNGISYDCVAKLKSHITGKLNYEHAISCWHARATLCGASGVFYEAKPIDPSDTEEDGPGVRSVEPLDQGVSTEDEAGSEARNLPLPPMSSLCEDNPPVPKMPEEAEPRKQSDCGPSDPDPRASGKKGSGVRAHC